MALHPVQELTKSDILAFKMATKRMLLEMALKAYPGTNPWSWIFREIVPGDATVTDFYDLKYKTAATAGWPQWMIDTTDQTVDALASILAAALEVDDEKFLGFMGVFDMCNLPAEYTGAAGQAVAQGALGMVDFKKGGSKMENWGTEQLYGYDEVVGLTDRPMVYYKKDAIDIRLNFQDITEDKPVGLRGYVCEKITKHVTPRSKFFGQNDYLRGGVDPSAELTVDQITALKNELAMHLYQQAVEDGTVKTMQEAMTGMVIRELIGGDDNAKVDFIDLDLGADQTAGQENWAEDSTLFTAGDLKNILASTAAVKQQKTVGFCGFVDRSAMPDVMLVRYQTGAGPIFVYQPEHVYAYRGTPIGYHQPVVYGQNEKVVIDLAVKNAIDHWWVPRGFTCELWSSTLQR